MKYLRLLIMLVVCASLLGLNSCGDVLGKNKHASKIELPDSTLVGKDLPTIEGSLSSYLEINPDAYVINLEDSVLTLTVNFKTTKKINVSEYADITFPGDSLTNSITLVLVDSVGNNIGDIKFESGQDSKDVLMAALTQEEGTPVQLTFTELSTSTAETRDLVAEAARNFKIIGNVVEKGNTAKIDELFNKFDDAWNKSEYYNSGYGGWETPNIERYNNLKISLLEQLKGVERYMNADQVQRLQRCKAKIASYLEERRLMILNDEGD